MIVLQKMIKMVNKETILYTVWAQIDPVIEKEWAAWMDTEHIPDVVKQGKFIRASRLHVREGDTLGNYVTIYEAEHPEIVKRYLDGPAKTLREDYNKHFGTKSKLTRIILEEVSTYENVEKR